MSKYLNEKEFKYNNIDKWHKSGYTGKGVKIANLEGANHKAWNTIGRVFDPFGISRHPDTNNHGDKVMDILLQVAPDIAIYMLPSGGQDLPNGGYGGNMIDKSIPYVEENEIHLVNASLTGNNNKTLGERVMQARERGIIFVTAAENTGKYDSIGYSSKNGWMTISASHMRKNGDIEIGSYSSRGDSIDFSQFSGLYVHSQTDKGYKIYEVGTSFAAPMFCGMLALVQQYFLENAGKALNQDQMYRFVLDNVVDLGDEGKDELYGHGIFVLPDPDSIDINKYIKINDKPKEESPQQETPKEENIMDKFIDINKNGWYYEAVKWAVENGIVNGKKNDKGEWYFEPNAPLTRAEYCQAEYNKANKEMK